MSNFELRYVVGFMIKPETNQVLLLQKQRPDFQRGKWNGVGGKVEKGESPIQAMVREFSEEAGVQTTIYDWQHTATVECHTGDAGTGRRSFAIYVYRNLVERWPTIAQMTDEPLEIFDMEDVYRQRPNALNMGPQGLPTLPNMKFILPLQFSFNIKFPVLFEHVETH